MSLETDLFKYLKVLEAIGELQNVRKGTHTAFTAYDTLLGATVWFSTPKYRIDRKLWLAYGPGERRIYKRSGRSDICHLETIRPVFEEE